MKALVTGATGFIGKNLQVRLSELGCSVLTFNRNSDEASLEPLIGQADIIYHLAGVNRPLNEVDFGTVNVGLTDKICGICRKLTKKPIIVYASSTQAENRSSYGESKRGGEKLLGEYQRDTGSAVFVYRLPNVFGKWSRPNYNSVVATFCHNISQGKTIELHQKDAPLNLVYIDDVIDSFIDILKHSEPGLHWSTIHPVYQVTVGALAEKIIAFKDTESTLTVQNVGRGLERALYATYLSFLKPSQFSFPLNGHQDSRGNFCEILKTLESGQFSFFTALPGVTRGNHYHHTKNEKFLVLQGEARFRFRNIVSNETAELFVSASPSQIVRTVPGWAHDITNVGDKELIVALWANEVFDRERPDTIPFGVEYGKSIKSTNRSGNSPRAY